MQEIDDKQEPRKMYLNLQLSLQASILTEVNGLLEKASVVSHRAAHIPSPSCGKAGGGNVVEPQGLWVQTQPMPTRWAGQSGTAYQDSTVPGTLNQLSKPTAIGWYHFTFVPPILMQIYIVANPNLESYKKRNPEKISFSLAKFTQCKATITRISIMF